MNHRGEVIAERARQVARQAAAGNVGEAADTQLTTTHVCDE